MWPHYSPFYHVCILNRTYCSELSWIPGKNSFMTWNNLVWTSRDHLLNLSAWVPTTTTTPMPWNFCTAVLHFVPGTVPRETAGCKWVLWGSLRFARLNQISHFPKLIGSCFSSTCTSLQITILILCWEKLSVTLQKILCTSQLQNSVIFKKGCVFSSFFLYFKKHT